MTLKALTFTVLSGCASGPTQDIVVVPEAPPLPVEAIRHFSDAWVEAAAPLPPVLPVFSDSFSGPLDDAWVGARSEAVGAVGPVPGVPDSSAWVVGDARGIRRLAPLRRTVPAPPTAGITANVRVIDGGLSGEGQRGPPFLRLVILGPPDEKGRSRILSQKTVLASYRLPDAAPVWETLTVDLDLPTNAHSVRVELSPGSGSASGWLAFDDVVVEGIPAARRVRPPVSRYLTATDHARLRSVRAKDTQRPSVLSPTPDSWVLPVPPSSAALVFSAYVAVPRVRMQEPGEACWSVVPLPAGDEVTGCAQAGTGWEPVRLALPPGTRGLRLSTRAAHDGAPYAPLAWGAPRVDVAAAPPDPRPDIVLVVIDTLRADGLGNPTRAVSPALDGLDIDRYTRAVSTSNWTLASVASMLTGRYPAAHGAGRRNRMVSVAVRPGSVEWKARTYTGISPDVPTLAETLRQAGYCTEAFVTNFFVGASFGMQRGFDSFVQYPGNSVVGAEHLLSQLQGRETCTGPRFTFLHLFEPHMPLRLRSDAPSGWVSEAQTAALDLATETAKDGRTARVLHSLHRGAKDVPATIRALYDAETWHADRLLGRLLPEVAPAGTGLVVVSDHGENLGEGGQWGHGIGFATTLLHVPLWVRSPSFSGPGIEISEPVSLVDIAPTIAAWAGAPMADSDGLELDRAPAHDRLLWAEFPYAGAEGAAVVSGDRRTHLQLGAGALDRLASPEDPLWEPQTHTVSWPAGDGREVDASAQEALYARLTATQAGWQVVCPRPWDASARTVTAHGGSIARITPLAGTERAAPAPSLRSFTVVLEPGAQDYRVAVELAPGGFLSVSDEACHVHRGGTAGEGNTLDGDTIEALESIGYFGGD